MATRRLFGLEVAGDLPLGCAPVEALGPPDLTYERLSRGRHGTGWWTAAPAYISPLRTADGDSAARLYRLGDCDILSLTGIADYYLWDDRIAAHLLDPDQEPLVEIHLLGTVLACWLERRGIPVLHAAAVVADGRGVGFLAGSGGGKSALAAAGMAAGWPLLTDDLLAVEERDGVLLGRPGYPQMRMWPDLAEAVLGGCRGLEPVHPRVEKRRVPVGPRGFGAFQPDPAPLGCLYLPERRQPGDAGPDVIITPVSRQEAVRELLRGSFVARLGDVLGSAAERLDRLVRLARQVPLRRLSYPSGLGHLGRVREALAADLARL